MLRNIINFDELMALIKGIADNAATTPEDAAKIARTKITSLRVDGQGGHTMPVMWQAGGDVGCRPGSAEGFAERTRHVLSRRGWTREADRAPPAGGDHATNQRINESTGRGDPRCRS